MTTQQILRTTGFFMLTIGVAAGIGALVVRDQVARHQRDLFSGRPLRRFAALGYLSVGDATVEAVQLLRDFIAWEPQPFLRRRAHQVLRRMETALGQRPGEIAG